MAASPSKPRGIPFAVVGWTLLLLALAGIYLGAADPLRLWPYGR